MKSIERQSSRPEQVLRRSGNTNVSLSFGLPELRFACSRPTKSHSLGERDDACPRLRQLHLPRYCQLSQLLQPALLKLPDTFTCHAQFLGDLLQRSRFKFSAPPKA